MSYTAPAGLVATVLVLMGGAFVLLGFAAAALLVLRRRVEEVARRESNTTEAVDRLTHMITTPDQAWFWTPEWQAGEHEAEEDIDAGRTSGPMDEEGFMAHLARLDADATARERNAGRVAA